MEESEMYYNFYRIDENNTFCIYNFSNKGYKKIDFIEFLKEMFNDKPELYGDCGHIMEWNEDKIKSFKKYCLEKLKKFQTDELEDDVKTDVILKDGNIGITKYIDKEEIPIKEFLK